MATPIRERILARMANRYSTITISNGYNFDIVAVFRNGEINLQIDEKPCGIIYDRGDQKRRHLRMVYENRMRTEIKILNHEYDTDLAPLNLGLLASDFEKVIVANEKWNDGSVDLARRTFCSEYTPLVAEVAKPLEHGILVVETIYRTLITDPTTLSDI